MAEVKDAEFERILVNYIRNVRIVKQKAVMKYGRKAKKWFGV